MKNPDHPSHPIADLLYRQKVLNSAQQAAVAQALHELAAGHTACQLQQTQSPSLQESQSPLLQQQGGWMSIQAMAHAEESIWQEVLRRTSTSFSLSQQPDQQPTGLSQEQLSAARHALHAPLFLLEGGPGTGKTFTAAWLIEQSAEKRWLALAPTGKAKAQLEMSLRRYGLNPDQVATLQGALARMTSDGGWLQADLVLVDESSMLDTPLFYRLLKALKPTTQLLLLGDRHQLPPVGPGQPFADLCSQLEGGPLHARLSQSKRVEASGLLQIAQAIQRGQPRGVPCQPLGSVEHTVQAVLQFHQRSLPADPEALLLALSERMVLGSLQEGPWGITELQAPLQEMCVDPLHPWRPAPLMILANSEQADLWNGDLGWLCRPEGEAPFVLLAERKETDRKVRRIPLASLPSWDYAWLLTVHKAQGSEFQHVAVVLPAGSERFGRQLLYTAATRARKSLEVWTWSSTLDQILLNPRNRQTWLNQVILRALKPTL